MQIILCLWFLVGQDESFAILHIEDIFEVILSKRYFKNVEFKLYAQIKVSAGPHDSKIQKHGQ